MPCHIKTHLKLFYFADLEIQVGKQCLTWNLDALFCEENHLGGGYYSEERKQNQVIKNVKKTSPLLECELFWKDDELGTLLSKEKDNFLDWDILVPDGFLMG